jgi:hypothetical protein
MLKTGNVKTILIALVAIALVISTSILMPVQQAAATSPTHNDIQNTIDLASGFIDSLYKYTSPAEVSSGSEAVLAEYPALPIRVQQSDGRIIRAGEDVDIWTGWKTNVLDTFSETASDAITYRIHMRSKDIFNSVYDKTPLLQVTVDFDYGASHHVKVDIKNQQWDSGAPVSYADIYFGNSWLGRATPANVGTTWSYTSNMNFQNDAVFRSFRYIERHATQLGREWYNANLDSTKGTALATRLTDEGYTLGRDIYSPMFGSATSEAYNYQYQSGSSGVYRDCYTEPSIRDQSYQYHSKVCNSVDAYITYSRSSDWLVPTLWAIHQLNKGVGVDVPTYDGYQTWSPRQVARFVEGKWIADIGIRSPYSTTQASAVRTAAFLTLETMLGYGSTNDSTSRTYADKAASALLNPQVKSNGVVTRENEDGSFTSLTRPLLRGGVYTAWNGFNYVTKNSVLQQISDAFNQPDETLDIKPSNAESTITVAQSLRVYDCYVYGTSNNCVNVP